MFFKRRIYLIIKGMRAKDMKLTKESNRGINNLLIERLNRWIDIERKTMIDIEMRGVGMTIRMKEKEMSINQIEKERKEDRIDTEIETKGNNEAMIDIEIK